MRYFIISFVVVLFITACRKFVELDTPKTQITTATVYSSDVTAISAMSGIYAEMVNINTFTGGGEGSISMLLGLSSDELKGYNGEANLFENNALTSNSTYIRTGLWEPAYRLIYFTNALMEGLNSSVKISEATKTQLTGEAKFVRALCYFYLVNSFGNIPIATTTDYRINNTLSRATIEQVYRLIVSDLSDAKEALKADYSSSGEERIKPNKIAASALLARVYLYMENWTKAEEETTLAITSSLYSLPSIEQVFLKESAEAIWQLKPVQQGRNTNEGAFFIFTLAPSFVSLNPDLLNAFESGDLRKTYWVAAIADDAYYYPFKYKIADYGKPLSEYSIVLRLAEQFLIRSEARAHQDKLVEAINDLDMIRDRAGLSLIADTDPSIAKTQLLIAIEQERRVELFSEWGHRWLDLKRTDRANTVLAPIKPSWQATDQLYPIPQIERERNSRLEQNNGY